MKIISEHKKYKHRRIGGKLTTPPKRGFKRVMAIENGATKHIDIKK